MSAYEVVLEQYLRVEMFFERISQFYSSWGLWRILSAFQLNYLAALQRVPRAGDIFNSLELLRDREGRRIGYVTQE